MSNPSCPGELETNMADDEAEEMLGETNLVETSEIITIVHGNEEGTEVVSEDILQQALEEASGGFDHSTVEYVPENVPVADGSVSLTGNNTISVNETYDTQYELITNVPETDADHTGHTHTIQLAPGQSLLKASQVQQIIGIGDQQQHVNIQDSGETTVMGVTDAQSIQAVNGVNMVPTPEEHILQNGELMPVSAPATQTVTVLSNANNTGPLGSSQNPIRIVQQGNQYTSLQQLSQEQLSQIMQVVQQQQLAKTTAEGGGSSILFNPQTQTRIVYRVIYPSELHKTPGGNTSSTSITSINSGNAPRTVQVPTKLITVQAPPKRAYRRRNKGEDEERVDGPELSKEEKEERKKHRPRTRSGRVSRPPKHMVQDYKHIHPLDWDEDYDDSDGGYSDFKQSEGEEEDADHADDISKRHLDQAYTLPGQRSLKDKNFKCETCNKAYIGRAGLGRHFRLNPSHGHLEPLDEDSNNAEDLNRMQVSATDDSEINPVLGSTNGTCGTEMTPGPVSSTSAQTTSHPAKPRFVITNRTVVPTKGGDSGTNQTQNAPRGMIKARQTYIQENNPIKRKNRLKELVRQCEDEELMEVVLPRLAKVITLWEFLLMKVERGRPLKPHFLDIFREFEQLHKQVAKMCQEYLKPAAGSGGTGENMASGGTSSQSNKIQITNQAVAQSLGLAIGPYEVHDTPVREESTKFQYKLLTADPVNLQSNVTSHGKRTVELVTPDQLVVQAPSKRPRLEAPAVSQAVSMPSSIASNSLPVTTTIKIINGDTVTEDATEEMPVEETVDDSPVPQDMEDETQESVDEPIVRTHVSGASGGSMHVIMTNGQLVLKQDTDSTSAEQDEHDDIPNAVVHVKSEKPVKHETAVKAELVNIKENVTVTTDSQLASHQQQPIIVSVSGASGPSSSNQHDSNVTFVDADNNVQVYSEPAMNSEHMADHQDIAQGHVVLANGETQVQGHMEHGQVIDEDGNIVVGLEHIHHMENQVMEGHVEGHLQEVHMDGAQVTGQIIDNDGVATQVLIHQEDMEQQVVDHANIYQTAEGLILIQNPDGTFALHGQSDQPIPLETVQALLAMENEGQAQVEQVDET